MIAKSNLQAALDLQILAQEATKEALDGLRAFVEKRKRPREEPPGEPGEIRTPT